jgi:hypothetical protein
VAGIAIMPGAIVGAMPGMPQDVPQSVPQEGVPQQSSYTMGVGQYGAHWGVFR